MLATDLARALDPVRLARDAGLEPDPWQADLLRSRADRVLMLCSRQSGKSTVAAVMAVDEALHRPPALGLLLAPALRQSQELFRKVKAVLEGVDTAPPVAQESALSLELENGSRIVCLPGQEKTVRGYSGVGLLVVDEASRVPDDLYQAVRPMLAVSGGRLVALTTPWGQRGFFHHEWTEGGRGWKRVRVTAEDCPRIAPEWLAEERQRIPDLWWRSEYLCEFVDTDDAVFTTDLVVGAVDDTVAPLEL